MWHSMSHRVTGRPWPSISKEEGAIRRGARPSEGTRSTQSTLSAGAEERGGASTANPRPRRIRALPWRYGHEQTVERRGLRSPLVRRASPLGRQASPLGRQPSPLGRHTSPLERQASPLERQASPLERQASPLERQA